MHIIFSTMTILSPNPMFYHFLESSHQDYTYKWSNRILWRNNISTFDWSKFHTSYLGLCLLVYRYTPRICDTLAYSFLSVCLSLHKTYIKTINIIVELIDIGYSYLAALHMKWVGQVDMRINWRCLEIKVGDPQF